MADDFGVGRGLFLGGNQITACSHGVFRFPAKINVEVNIALYCTEPARPGTARQKVVMTAG
jgi:hypothetical protein